MLISRAPLRISLGGGGTDLASYYEKFGGFFISAAIDKYVYITVHQSWNDKYILKYSHFESADTIEQLNHPIFKAVLDKMRFKPNIELVSIADIPAGTGLGSSGSFTIALLKALHAHRRNLLLSPHELAEQACEIEIDILKEPIGKQDQYIASYGGITNFWIEKDGRVKARPARIAQRTMYALEDNLAMFFTGYSRSASDLLREQNDKSKVSDSEMIENLHFVKDIGYRIKDALEQDKPDVFGELMHEHWLAKKKRSKNMSNQRIDELYEGARMHGAIGGKLIGAGGGGFLLFYTENKRKLRDFMTEQGLTELRFNFDFEGAKIMVW